MSRHFPGAWLHVLATLLSEGQATAQEIADDGHAYTLRTVSSTLSHMLPAGFVQHCGRKTWGLTKDGIQAALTAEQEAAALLSKIAEAELRQAGAKP